MRMTVASLLFDRHEDRVPHLVVDRLRQMPLAAGVLDQDHLAGADDAGLAVARRQFHACVKVDDVLPSRRRMPRPVMLRLGLAEDDAVCRKPRRGLSLTPFLPAGDLDIPPRRVALPCSYEMK